MPKYQINYGRVAPDHRVPFDYHFVKKIQNPLQYLKAWKKGFNSSWYQFYHIHLMNTTFFFACFVLIYKFWDNNGDQIVRDKLRRLPAMHFIRQLHKENKAPYDNVLLKFVTDPMGNKDLPFNDL